MDHIIINIYLLKPLIEKNEIYFYKFFLWANDVPRYVIDNPDDDDSVVVTGKSYFSLVCSGNNYLRFLGLSIITLGNITSHP